MGCIGWLARPGLCTPTPSDREKAHCAGYHKLLKHKEIADIT